MTINPSDFLDGAVRVQERRLQGHIGALIKAFPVAAEHRQALRNLGSDFVYAAPSPIDNDHGSWVALVRFGAVIERRFGITREVLAYYSPHSDLQLRTYQRLSDLSAKVPRPVTPDMFLMWASDPMINTRLDDWSSRAPHVAVALPKAGFGDPTQSIWDNLVKRLTETNLYDQTLPVTGRDFFGRQPTLRDLTEHLISGRVSGVFGLRKIGKTSLVKELGRRAAQTPGLRQIFVLRDLETLPSHQDAQVGNLLEDLRVNLLAELRAHSLRTHELVSLPTMPTVADFRRALHSLLAHVAKNDTRVVLALDEIESLVGPAADWNQGRPEVVELLGALRALVQENSNFNVVVSGLTSSILEKGELFSRENPFFAWASTIFLPPLTLEESSEILIRLGERMAVTWSEDAINRATVIADGHVFLLRTLATRVVEKLPRDLTKRVVTVDLLNTSLRQWRRSVAGQVNEMLGSVERYYPDEHGLLELWQDSPNQAAALEEAYPVPVEHLIQLGLLAEHGDSLRLTALGAFGRHDRTVDV